MPPKKHRHLTPEEKKELKKQKVLARKLQKIEKKKQTQRDHLAREIKYGQTNYKKYEKQWREMLIRVALPRMRAELEFAWHNFERVIDCRDFTISLLMDELRDSEEQHMLNFRMHSDNIQKILKIYYERLVELRIDYEEEVKQMQQRCSEDLQDIREDNNENLEYLKTMMYRLEVEKKEHTRLKKGDYFSRLDEVGVKNQLAVQKLKVAIEKKYESTFEDMKHFIKEYNIQIKDKKKEHTALKDQDDSLQEVIGQQFHQIKKNYDIIRQLKQKYIDMKQTDGSAKIDLESEKHFFANSLLVLKRALENDMKNDFDKLARLSEYCSRTFDFLENLNKKGEMILSMAAVCRKLETRKEKVLTFPLQAACPADLGKDLPDEIGHVEGIIPEMELFWQRMGQVFGTQYALSREKKCLTEENELIVHTHNEYCERLMFPPIKPYKTTVAIPKTDGNFEMSKYT